MRNLVNTTGYTKGEPTNNNPFNVIPGNHIKAGDKDVTLIPIVGGKPQYDQKVILRRGEPDVKFDDIVEGVLELPMAQIGVGPLNTTSEDRESMNRFWKNPLASTEVLAGESPYVRRYAGVRGSLSDAYSGGSLEPTAPMSIFTPQQSIDNFQMPYQEEWDPRRNMSSFSEYQKTTQPSTLLNQYGRTTEEEVSPDSYSDTLNKSIKEFEDGIEPDGTKEENDDFAYLSAWNPYTSISTDTAFAHAGAALGKDGKELFGGVGRYAVGIGGLGKGILSASRNFLGGMAAANRYSQALAEYEANKARANKKQSERTENTLRRGGIIGSYIDIFKEGGIKEATGNYIEGEDDNYSANTLVEAGEHVLFPGGESVEVIGDRHSDKTKGELLNLPPGTKVISDYLQIGGKIAKKIKKDYGLRVTSTNKFATVIDKFKRKIGLQDLIDEEEKIIKRVAAQKDITHQDTRDLNLEFLGKKLQDIQSKKDPLEADLSEFTDYVFQLQESSKATKKDKKKMQEGGMAEEGQADEIIQIIVAYAEMTRQDPEQLLQRLESMPPEEARAEIERIIREVQGQQGPGAAQGNQNEIQQTNMKRKGGFSHFLQSGGAVAGPNIEEVVMAYAQLIGVSPEEIMQALGEMSPEEQQQAMEQMMTELQQAQQQGQPQPQQEQPMMQMGGQAQQPQLNPEEVIVAYAQMIGVSPEEIMQELEQMEVAEQQQAFENMVYELQNSQQQQPSTMRRGGFSQFLQSGGAVAPTNLEEVVMAYAQLIGVAPEEIMQALEQMSTEEQKQAVDQMMMELQQGQPQPEQQAMMQEGGQSGPNPEDIIMAYAQLIGVTPEEIMTELEQMSPEEREQAFQQMLMELQENSQQTMMQSGGETGGPSMEEVVLIYAQMVGKDAIEIMEELDKMTPEDREQALQQMSTEVQSQVNSGNVGTTKPTGGFSDFMRDGGITYMQEGGGDEKYLVRYNREQGWWELGLYDEDTGFEVKHLMGPLTAREFYRAKVGNKKASLSNTANKQFFITESELLEGREAVEEMNQKNKNETALDIKLPDLPQSYSGRRATTEKTPGNYTLRRFPNSDDYEMFDYNKGFYKLMNPGEARAMYRAAGLSDKIGESVKIDEGQYKRGMGALGTIAPFMTEEQRSELAPHSEGRAVTIYNPLTGEIEAYGESGERIASYTKEAYRRVFGSAYGTESANEEIQKMVGGEAYLRDLVLNEYGDPSNATKGGVRYINGIQVSGPRSNPEASTTTGSGTRGSTTSTTTGSGTRGSTTSTTTGSGSRGSASSTTPGTGSSGTNTTSGTSRTATRTSTGRSIVELGDIDYDFAYINPVAAYEEYAKQSASGDGVYGGIDLKERLGVYDRLGGKFFKSVYEKDENGEYKLKEGKTVKDLQKAYQDQIKDTAAMLIDQGFSKEEINDYVDSIRFDEDGKMGTTSRLLDDKLGQFTTSRSFFQKKVVTDEQLRELNEQGIFTARDVEDNKDKVVELYGEEIYNSIVEGLDKYQNADYVLASKGKGEEPKKKEEEQRGKTNTDSDVGELSKRKPMADLPALLPDQGGHINPRMGLVTMNEIKSEDAERFAIDSTAQKRQVFDQSRLASREAASMTPYAGQAAIANINAEAFKSLNQIDSQTNIANQKDARDVSMMNTQRRAQQDLQNLQFKDNYERNTLTMLDHYVGEWNSKITRDNEENMARFNFQEQMNAYNALNPNYKRSFDGRVVVFDDSFFGGYKEAMTEEEKKKQEEEQLRNQQNIVGKVPVLGTASPKPKRKGGIVRQSFIDLLNTFKLD